MTTRPRRRLGLVALTAAVALASTLTLATGAEARTAKMALGVSMVPSDDLDVVDQFTIDSGRPPAIWSVWTAWAGSNSTYPTALIQGLHSRGITPMIIWEPANPANNVDPQYSYRHIINGDFDGYIRTFAQAAKDAGGTVLLRWAHEMNGTWMPWSTNRFDNTPARFKKMWHHVYDIFKGPGGVGATNVRFLFSPNEPCARCVPIADVYPGDAYVDFVGLSAFNWGSPHPWRSMVQKFLPTMQAYAALTRKKVIVTETASSAAGGNKAAWIRLGYPAVYDKWPRLKAIVYFNIDMSENGHPDWRLTSPTNNPFNAYKALLAQPAFHGVIN